VADLHSAVTNRFMLMLSIHPSCCAIQTYLKYCQLRRSLAIYHVLQVFEQKFLVNWRNRRFRTPDIIRKAPYPATRNRHLRCLGLLERHPTIRQRTYRTCVSRGTPLGALNREFACRNRRCLCIKERYERRLLLRGVYARSCAVDVSRALDVALAFALALDLALALELALDLVFGALRCRICRRILLLAL